MNTDLLNPFLESFENVLSTMAFTSANRGEPVIKEGNKAYGDITGIIGLTGLTQKGSLAITFTNEAILKIASNMLAEEFAQVTDEVVDVVGEITNIVTGGAKRVLSEKGYQFELATPSLIIGKNHVVIHKTKGEVVIVPYAIDGGSFYLELCLDTF
ncbi:MAG: chemotaxis protein CheX [Candidatus Magnetoovum sp. WYHC-5]|nr:chemotaxis protein CheX [Candidatus Magnetoovum sp. WYHC-5]